MADARFFDRSGPFSLGEIAAALGADALPGADADFQIHDVAALEAAGPQDISVFSDIRYLDALGPSRAGAIIISRKLSRHAPQSTRLIFVPDPRFAYAQVGRMFYPLPSLQPGIDETARVHTTATIGKGCQIDAGAVIGPNVELGERCHIGCNAVIGAGVMIGSDARIGANSSVSHALLGDRVNIETCVSIGSQGFGFVKGKHGLERMLQLGRVIVEDDVQIGANCAIDRGATGDTVIGAGTVLDNLVHLGHNVRIGRHCIICGQVGIAGSSTVGDGVIIGGQAGIADHRMVGSKTQIAAKSGVMRDVPPASIVGGFPAVPIKTWHRQTVEIAKLAKRNEEP